MATHGGYPQVRRDAFFVSAHMFVIDQARKMISRTLGQSDLGLPRLALELGRFAEESGTRRE
jgi:hypothetical protein